MRFYLNQKFPFEKLSKRHKKCVPYQHVMHQHIAADCGCYCRSSPDVAVAVALMLAGLRPEEQQLQYAQQDAVHQFQQVAWAGIA